MVRYSFYANDRHPYLKPMLFDLEKRFAERDIVKDDLHPDIIFVFGGDGTLLHAVKDLHKLNAPFLLVNDGTLGYYKEYDLKETDALVKNFSYDEITLEKHHFIEIADHYNHRHLACNEFMLASSIKTLDFVVYINGIYFMEVHGSGVCVTSSFGSTGYNHSLGGALFTSDDSLGLSLLSPIRNRVYHPLISSLVTSKGDHIGLEVLKGDSYELAADMTDIHDFVGLSYSISIARETFKLAHVKPFSPYQRMRKGFIEN